MSFNLRRVTVSPPKVSSDAAPLSTWCSISINTNVPPLSRSSFQSESAASRSSERFDLQRRQKTWNIFRTNVYLSDGYVSLRPHGLIQLLGCGLCKSRTRTETFDWIRADSFRDVDVSVEIRVWNWRWHKDFGGNGSLIWWRRIKIRRNFTVEQRIVSLFFSFFIELKRFRQRRTAARP